MASPASSSGRGRLRAAGRGSIGEEWRGRWRRGCWQQIELSGFVARELSTLGRQVSGLTVPRLVRADRLRTGTDSRFGTSLPMGSTGVARSRQPEPRGAQRAAAKGGSGNAPGHSELSRRVARPRDAEMGGSQVGGLPHGGAFSVPPRHRPARGTCPPPESRRTRTRRACAARGTPPCARRGNGVPAPSP